MKKLLLLSTFLCICLLQTFASEYTDKNGVTWTWSKISVNGTYEAEITKASNYGLEVVVPEKVYDSDNVAYTVTRLGSVFNSDKLLQKVTLPTTVTYLYNTFNGCSSLTKVENTGQIKTFGGNTFNGCSTLSEIDLSSCTTVGYQSFYNCQTLKSANLTNQCTSISYNAFSYCSNLTSVGDLSGVTSISWSAFFYCSKLTSVDLSNCTKIESHTFYGCSSLESVGNLSKVTSIDSDAFDGCYKLSNVNLSNCSYIGQEAFSGCGALTSVDLSSIITLSSNAFYNCSNLTSVTGLSHLNQIPSQAFCNCTALTTVDLSNCTNIGSLAFSGCTSLTSVDLSNCTNIGSLAFSGCTGIEAVALPATLTKLGSNCFADNTVVTIAATTPPTSIDWGTTSTPTYGNYLIKVPADALATYKTADGWSASAANIFSIGDVFEYNVTTMAQESTSGLLNAVGQENADKVVKLKISGTINGYDVMVMRNKFIHLTDLDMENATIVANDYKYYSDCCTKDTVIGDYMFYETNLTRVVLPKNVRSIKSYAFSKSKVREVQMFDGVEWIYESAFRNCAQLKSITLPKTVKRVDGYAFEYCSQLKTVVLGDSVTALGYGCFFNCSALESVEIPSSLKKIEESAFYGCSNLKNISLALVENIGNSAFCNCSQLSNVKIPSSLQSIGNNAFSNCNKLNSIYTYTIEPVSIDQNTFSTYSTATLYIPQQAWDNYYWNTQWSQFRELREFNEPYSYFYLNNKYTLGDRFNGKPDIDINPGGGFVIPEDNKGDQNAGDVHIKGDGFKNWASIIAHGNINADNVYIDITIQANRWYFFSFPFEIKRENVFCGKNVKFVFRYYDGAERANNGKGGWKDLPDNQEYLEKGKGYIFQASMSCTLTIKIEKTAFANLLAKDETTKLEKHESTSDDNANWNFVGNPTTGYYDINDMSYTAPITRWNSDTKSYEAYRPGDDDYDLHPFEAFFVQRPESTDELKFEADKRMTQTDSKAKATADSPSGNTRMGLASLDNSRQFVNLTLSNGTTTDKTRIVYNEAKSAKYESDCDASKFDSGSSVALYSVEAQAGRLAINERPEGDVKLGYNAPAAGAYTISALRMDKPVLLRDNETQATYDLTNGDYTFASEAGTFDNRFTLVVSSLTSIADVAAETGVSLRPTCDGISISGLNGTAANIYNAAGVHYATCSQDGFVNLPKATYLVEIGNMKTKLMVK